MSKQANPTFVMYVGPMWSSKSSRLLMELERCKYQKRNALVFKPAIDDRYSTTQIVTHGGWRHDAVTVDNAEGILAKVLEEQNNDISIIAVDEAFMINGVADALTFLYRNGYSIIVSTLDTAYNGKPFDEVTKMLPWATSIEKCSAVCTICSQDAHFTYKKSEDETLLEVGGHELYEPRCLRCHPFIVLT